MHRRVDLFIVGIYKGYYKFLWVDKYTVYRSAVSHLGFKLNF